MNRVRATWKDELDMADKADMMERAEMADRVEIDTKEAMGSNMKEVSKVVVIDWVNIM